MLSTDLHDFQSDDEDTLIFYSLCVQTLAFWWTFKDYFMFLTEQDEYFSIDVYFIYNQGWESYLKNVSLYSI